MSRSRRAAGKLNGYSCSFGLGRLKITCPPESTGPWPETDSTGGIEASRTTGVVETCGHEISNCLISAARFFSIAYGYPAPSPAGRFKPGFPEISCIIVLHRNVHFVRELMIPALLSASGHHVIEIIVVDNGGADVVDWMDEVRLFKSADQSVARAYNLGVKHARAPIVALFHDDCILDDPFWIEKIEAAGKAGADVISPEIRRLEKIGAIPIKPLPVLKNVPLVLRREVFDALQGYDEDLFIGYEDLEFTLRLLSKGYRTARVGLGYRHFGGMSSCLKYLNRPGLDLLFTTLAVPDRTILEAFAAFSTRPDSLPAGLLSAMNMIQLCAVVERHQEHVSAGSVDINQVLERFKHECAGRAGIDLDALLSTPLAVLDRRLVELNARG